MTFTFLSRDELKCFLDTVDPDEVTVTGVTGSTWTHVLEVLGKPADDPWVGTFRSPIRTRYTLLMKQLIGDDDARYLTALGLGDARMAVYSLYPGEAILITDGAEPQSSC